jgi:hypothetical protein
MWSKVRIVLAVCLAAALGSLVGAGATGLGTITPKTLGADRQAITPCDSDGVDSTYVNTWDPAISAYRTTSVTVFNIATTCTSQLLQLTFANAVGTSLAASSGTVTATSHTYTYALASAPRTDQIAMVALVISG